MEEEINPRSIQGKSQACEHLAPVRRLVCKEYPRGFQSSWQIAKLGKTYWIDKKQKGG